MELNGIPERIKALSEANENTRMHIAEFLPFIRYSIDVFSLDTIEEWMSVFSNKMDDVQIASIIRAAENDGFLYPIGIGMRRMWTDDDNFDFVLEIGNGHHRLMIGILASALQKNKITDVLSKKAIEEFTNPLVVIGNTWPKGSSSGSGRLAELHDSDDYYYFAKSIEPYLPLVREYIQETVLDKNLVPA